MSESDRDIWEEFAIAALQGRLSGEARVTEETTVLNYGQLASDVWNIADAMLAEMKARVDR